MGDYCLPENIPYSWANSGKMKTSPKISKQKRMPLGVINGDISNRKYIPKKLKEQTKESPEDEIQKTDDEAESSAEKIQEISERVERLNKENQAISEQTISPESLFFSSPEYIEVSPENQRESLFTYSKRKKTVAEPVWYTPYKEDILTYLREIEQRIHIKPRYMEQQVDLNMKMRSILVDWCVEVVEEYNLHAETLHLAVSYVDRFLSSVSVTRDNLQLVGTASLFVASKYEEIYPPELKDFVFITDNTYTKQQILRMEHLVLKALNFDLSLPTAYSFLQIYLSMCNPSEEMKHLSQYICEITLLIGGPFLYYSPSIIAAGSLALAKYVLRAGWCQWDEDMADQTGYTLKDLRHVCDFLYSNYYEMPRYPEKALFEKYKAQKFRCVSLIFRPKTVAYPFDVSPKDCSCSYCSNVSCYL